MKSVQPLFSISTTSQALLFRMFHQMIEITSAILLLEVISEGNILYEALENNHATSISSLYFESNYGAESSSPQLTWIEYARE